MNIPSLTKPQFMKRQLTLLILLSSTLFSFSQQLVKGYVLDEQKDPLVGANVIVKGTLVGTITDADGNFSLTIPAGSDVFVVSYIGYKSLEIQANEGNIEVILSKDPQFLEEVVVVGFSGNVGRARRRAASVQSIPESVTTFTAEQIDATGVNNIQTFAAQVPNVSFNTSQNVGVNFLTVRGIPQIRNGESPVAFVIDGITIIDPNLINQELYDLAMVEVVKGPQGTLYGKNAIGGAINILTQAPTNYAKNRLTLGYGNGNSFKAQLSSSGPLVKDKVYYRISGSYRDSDGVIENETLDMPVDFLKDLSLRGQLTFDLSSRFSATLVGQLIDTEGGAVYYAHSPSGLQLDADDFNYVIDADQFGESTLDNTYGALKLKYAFNKAILTSVTSFNSAQRNHVGDLDFTPVDILRQDQDSDSETFNQEFRLSSNDPASKLSWDLGAFYQASERTLLTQALADFGFFAEPPAATGELGFLPLLSDYTSEFRTIAVFGFLDYKLSDKFTASIGLRFDNDEITQVNRLFDTEPTKSQSELQPKVSLAYQATENVLIYANYGRGYRSGGFNSTSTDQFNSEYDGETSDNFELGLKTSTRDKRFIFNLAAFYIDFNNQQQYVVGVGPNAGFIIGNFNFPETEVLGFEADLKYRTSNFLDIIAGVGITNSEIITGGMDGGFDRTPFEGNKTPFVPQSTFNIALQSDFPISTNIDFAGFLSLNNKGKIYWHEDNNDVADPFSLLDGRVGLTFNKKFTVTLWGANILNTDYYQEYSAFEVSGSAAGDIGWIGQPRTYGAELTLDL